MKKIIFLVTFIFTSIAYAQNDRIKITGKVIDEKGIPLAGVKILYDTKNFSTDFDGSFSVNVRDGNSFLTFSYIGFATKTVTVGEQRELTVTLYEATNKLEEIVVVGYGTQKRSNVTGAIAKVKSEKFEQAPVSRLDQALQGKIAGVAIQNISSEAGADTQIRIRGTSSVNASQSPLIVVDGQIISDGLSFVNTADVESVEVLKDVASAAIYGSRASGGVILITTKSGKAEKPKYTFRTSLGFKEAYKIHDMLTTSEYVTRLYQERDLKATDPSVPPATNVVPAGFQAQYVIENNFFGGQGIDYQDEVLRTALFQDNQLSIAGGKKDLRYFISAGYQGDEGLMIKSNFQKINVRAKIDINLSEKLKLNINLNPSHIKTEFPALPYNDFYRFASFLPLRHNSISATFVNQTPQWSNIRPGDIAEAVHFYNLVYTGTGPDGSPINTVPINPFTTNNNNPLNAIVRRDQNQDQFRFQGSAALSYKIMSGLEFKTTFNGYLRNSERLNWDSTNSTQINSPNRGEFITNTYFDFLNENTLSYKKTFGSHSIDAVLGYTFNTEKITNEQVTGLNFPTDDTRTLINALSIDKAGTFSTKDKTGLISYLGRVNYALKDKYLLSVSYRTDGSSYFGPGQKWGAFPGASVGWVISKEGFMANANKINRLNLRASYGVSGNNRIFQFGYLDLLNTVSYPVGSGNGNAGAGVGLQTNITGNKDITWERTFQTNLGLDFIGFNNRLNLTVDAFRSRTDKLLLQQATQSFTGSNRYWNNAGSLDNIGIEAELSTTNINKDNFKWTTAVNVSHVKNEVANLGDVTLFRNLGERSEVYQTAVGSPLIEFYGFKTDGVWVSQDQINQSGLTTSLSNVFTPGGLRIVDVDGNKIIDNNDRTVIGNPYPDFTWGITNNFTYHGLDLGITIQGVQGGELINGDLNYNEFKQRNRLVNENRWVSAGNPGDGRTPYETNGINWMLTDYVVEDASYASLREVNLGYNFSKSATTSLGLSGLRFFASAQNLYFWTPKGYRGINPEARYKNGPYASALYDGYQRGGFPIPRTVVFGVEVNF